ncbi:MAG TPA: LytTR family DNA-binding domain-containing protein [Opitutus sp.]|nr:LytTR family DNA-binding domain-containing protein [Opitutus sp.]
MLSNPEASRSTPSQLRALLVDDERLVRKHLRQLLAEHPSVTVAGEAASVAEAATLAAQLQPDVIFLDVQMPPATGFDLLPLLDPAPAIIFVTAHDEFAVRAFAASAADYLLKPVAPERLTLALQHVRQGRPFAASPTTPAEPAHLDLDQALVLRDAGRIRRVRVSDIAALVAEGSYTRVHLAAERSMLVLKRMAAWEALLPAPPFLRLERSLLVNLDRIAGLDVRSRDSGVLTLDALNSPPLPLARVALVRLRAALPQ